MPIGLHEHHSGGVAEVAARGRKLLERCEPSLGRRELLLADAHVAGAGFVFRTGRRQFRLAGGTIQTHSLEQPVRADEQVVRGCPVSLGFLDVL